MTYQLRRRKRFVRKPVKLEALTGDALDRAIALEERRIEREEAWAINIARITQEQRAL